MKWIVTGSNGFIGTNLIEHLGEGVAAEWDKANVPFNVDGAVRGHEPENIIHLAAVSGLGACDTEPYNAFDSNVVLTFQLVRAWVKEAPSARFVFASSGAARPPVESYYGATKAAGEAFVQAAARQHDLWAHVLRFANVYGPHSWSKGSVVHAFVRDALMGKPLLVNSDGLQTRDFVYVDDVMEAILLCTEHPGKGGVLEIGSGEETPIAELAEIVRDIVGSVEIKLSGQESLGARRACADTTDAEMLLGWEPTVGLRDGVRRLVEWYEKEMVS